MINQQEPKNLQFEWQISWVKSTTFSIPINLTLTRTILPHGRPTLKIELDSHAEPLVNNVLHEVTSKIHVVLVN